MALDVWEAADGRPALIGRIPLVDLQMETDRADRRVTNSPANGGEWVLDLF